MAALNKQDKQVLFAALSVESRRNLLELVVSNPGMRHKELSLVSGQAGACWHHLHTLVKAGLITKTVLGRDDVQYFPNPVRIGELIGYFTKMNTQGEK